MPNALFATFRAIVDEPHPERVWEAAKLAGHAYALVRENIGEEFLAGDCLWAMATGTVIQGNPTISVKALTRLEAAVGLFNVVPDLAVFKAEKPLN